jgi:ABC-2 type transport system ATP-binding protein
MKIIEVNNLCKDYKYKVKDDKKGFLYNILHEKEKIVKAVNDISFDVEEGETVAFIGPNGAGKSTTIRTILGLLNKTSGNIYFNGKELDNDDIDVKEKIGYLPSEVNLYDDMKVKDIFNYHDSFYKKD